MKRVVGLSVLVLVGCVALAAEGRVPAHADERPRLLLEARDAVIQGDLDAARTAGAALAWQLERQGRMRNAKDEVRLRAAAVAIAEAPNLELAARGVADAVVACGDCHAVRGPLPVARPEPLPEGDALRLEMERHAGAMDQLWEGLLSPSGAALQAAAEMFTSSTLAPPGPALERARAADERVDEAALALATSPEGAERSAAFADLVVACAACHLARPDGVSIEPE